MFGIFFNEKSLRHPKKTARCRHIRAQRLTVPPPAPGFFCAKIIKNRYVNSRVFPIEKNQNISGHDFFFSKLKILKSVEKNCRLSVRIFKAISMAPDRNVPVGHRLAYIILYIRQTVSGWYIFVSPEQTWNFWWYIPENVPIRAGTFSRILGGAGIFCLERCANYADTGQTFFMNSKNKSMSKKVDKEFVLLFLVILTCFCNCKIQNRAVLGSVSAGINRDGSVCLVLDHRH